MLRLFSDTAMYLRATKSLSDRRHGLPRRTVRISPRLFWAAARAAMSGRPEEVHSATVHPQHLPGDPAEIRRR